jgi:Phosphotransferase enzyme family
MLTQDEITPYLLERKLVSAESIVEGDLAVVDASRRNRNFKVLSERGPSYLLKQGLGPEGRATVAHEAAVYDLLSRAEDDSGGLNNGYLPRCYAYDTKEHVLVLELLRDAQDLGEYHTRRGRFSVRVAAAMGDALAWLHDPKRIGANGLGKASPFSGAPAWPLTIHRPDLGIFRNASNAIIDLVGIVQGSTELCRLLDELRAGWKNEALIHRDVKWENYIVPARPSSRRNAGLKIVDWELADVGDPWWDVGSVFGSYLSFWLLSIPITGEAPPERFMELARYPLEKMHPAICAFWQSYTRHRNLDADWATQYLLRAVKYGAARLLQTGFEYSQGSLHLQGNILCLVQLSMNIMLRPHEAAVHLLGIPLHVGDTVATARVP